MKKALQVSLLLLFITAFSGCRSRIDYHPQTANLTQKDAESNVTRFLISQPRKRWNPAPLIVEYKNDRIIFGRDVKKIIYWRDVSALEIHKHKKMYYVNINKENRQLYRVFTDTLADAQSFVDSFMFLRNYYLNQPTITPKTEDAKTTPGQGQKT